MKRRLVETPVLAALLGAFCIAFSGILFRVAHVSPSTGAFLGTGYGTLSDSSA